MSFSRTNLTINVGQNYNKPVALSLNRSRLDDGVIEAYAATFENGGFRPGCFKASLDYHNACGTLPAMTWNGNATDVVGRWTSVVEDSTGLRVTGRLALNTERGSLIRQEILHGIDGLSAFVTVQARDSTGISAVNLHEISFMREAAIPSAPEASASAPVFGSAVEFEKWLRDKGVAKNAARKLAAGGWGNLQGRETDTEAEAQKLAALLSNSLTEIAYRR